MQYYDNRPKWLRNYNHKNKIGMDIVHFLQSESNTLHRSAFAGGLQRESIIIQHSTCGKSTPHSNYTKELSKVTCLSCAKKLKLPINVCKGRNIKYKYLWNKETHQADQFIDEEKSFDCTEKIANKEYCIKHDPKNPINQF